mmetsp:Transcript_43323/g.73674  ORF Transcript_43323/g.73674 Transcript_43323/m.73674 type:complete len:217 (-) Transcript_43323:613-1263(-)
MQMEVHVGVSASGLILACDVHYPVPSSESKATGHVQSVAGRPFRECVRLQVAFAVGAVSLAYGVWGLFFICPPPRAAPSFPQTISAYRCWLFFEDQSAHPVVVRLRREAGRNGVVGKRLPRFGEHVESLRGVEEVLVRGVQRRVVRAHLVPSLPPHCRRVELRPHARAKGIRELFSLLLVHRSHHLLKLRDVHLLFQLLPAPASGARALLALITLA